MLNDYSVKIIYANNDGQPTGERYFAFDEYCANQRRNILRTIGDVEKTFHSILGTKRYEEWNSETQFMFQSIRRNLLNSANEFSRLPNNLCYQGKRVNSVNINDMLADVLKK